MNTCCYTIVVVKPILSTGEVKPLKICLFNSKNMPFQFSPLTNRPSISWGQFHELEPSVLRARGDTAPLQQHLEALVYGDVGSLPALLAPISGMVGNLDALKAVENYIQMQQMALEYFARRNEMLEAKLEAQGQGQLEAATAAAAAASARAESAVAVARRAKEQCETANHALIAYQSALRRVEADADLLARAAGVSPSESQMRCRVCGKTFETFEFVLQHHLRRHRDAPPPSPPTKQAAIAALSAASEKQRSKPDDSGFQSILGVLTTLLTQPAPPPAPTFTLVTQPTTLTAPILGSLEPSPNDVDDLKQYLPEAGTEPIELDSECLMSMVLDVPDKNFGSSTH